MYLNITADVQVMIEDCSATGIARVVGQAISSRAVEPGVRLRPVRHLAGQLTVSPSTVAAAWQQLRRAGLIETSGKGGTRVRATAEHHVGEGRFPQLRPGGSGIRLDLSTGTPDPALLPDLHKAISEVRLTAATASYFDPPVLPALEAALRDEWPFPPQALTVVDGALDGLDRITRACVGFADAVLVESVTFPPILDLINRCGATPVPVDLDEEGPTVASLQERLVTTGARLFFLQPRSHNPCGHVLTARRAAALAAVLRGTGCLIVEDDHAAAISLHPAISIGSALPHQTVLVRSFSKSHGPDLRIAAVGGAASVVDAVVADRLLGSAWTSRLLQAVLLGLLTDPDTAEHVGRAAATYARRRHALVAALDQHGVTPAGVDGINLWISVHNERSALLDLASQGIAAAPGAPFCVDSGYPSHIRITIAAVRGDARPVAAAIAHAAHSRTPRAFGR